MRRWACADREQDAPAAVERELKRLRRRNAAGRSLTLAQLADEYSAQHEASPVTLEKLRRPLGMRSRSSAAIGSMNCARRRSPLGGSLHGYLVLAAGCSRLHCSGVARLRPTAAGTSAMFALEPLYRSIAVEVDGVVHRIKAQFQRDREKHNLALIAGWRVLHVSPDDVRSGKALFVLDCLLRR